MGKISLSVVFVAITSTVCGIIMTGVSSWILHRSLQARKNPTLVTATDLIHQVNTFFGGTTGLYDLDVIFRILISCSATGLVGGGVQFITSFCLLICGATGSMTRTLGLFWIGTQFFVMLAVGGAFLCIWTNELEINYQLRTFLITAGVDLVLILINCLILVITSLRRVEEGRIMGGVDYGLVTQSNQQKVEDLQEPSKLNYEIRRKQYNGVQVMPRFNPGSTSSVV